MRYTLVDNNHRILQVNIYSSRYNTWKTRLNITNRVPYVYSTGKYTQSLNLGGQNTSLEYYKVSYNQNEYYMLKTDDREATDVGDIYEGSMMSESGIEYQAPWFLCLSAITSNRVTLNVGELVIGIKVDNIIYVVKNNELLYGDSDKFTFGVENKNIFNNTTVMYPIKMNTTVTAKSIIISRNTNPVDIETALTEPKDTTWTSQWITTIAQLRVLSKNNLIRSWYYEPTTHKMFAVDYTPATVDTPTKLTPTPIEVITEKKPVPNPSAITQENLSGGTDGLDSALSYILADVVENDVRQFKYINRFRYSTPTGSMSKHGYIFMTKPDLNLHNVEDKQLTSGRSGDNILSKYYSNATGEQLGVDKINIDVGSIPSLKHIWNLPIGKDIFNSLEVTRAVSSDDKTTNTSPWLSVVTNTSTSYAPIDREVDYVEMGETYHGNKVIYAEPSFKHKIAGTTSISFSDRRDLSMLMTLKVWIEYMNQVSIGMCSPKRSHIYNGELDYAVSLYYVLADETMENIFYWEKLTGVIPLTVPESLFDWQRGEYIQNLTYSVDFAYSMRTVMNPNHLHEINFLYNNSPNMEFAPAKPGLRQNFTDKGNPSALTYYENLCKFYNISKSRLSSSSEKAPKQPNTINFSDFFKTIFKDNFYKEFTIQTQGSKDSPMWADDNKTVGMFLPNYIPELRTHGVPYVTGPFITYEYDTPGKGHPKYKLRWI